MTAWNRWAPLSWLASDTSSSIDPTQYGIAGVLFVVLGGVILRLFLLQRTDLLARVTAAETQRDKAIDQRDNLTQTFHDFVLAERVNTLEALKTSNQIAEDLLSKDEEKNRRIDQLQRDLEWERRGRQGP